MRVFSSYGLGGIITFAVCFLDVATFDLKTDPINSLEQKNRPEKNSTNSPRPVSQWQSNPVISVPSLVALSVINNNNLNSKNLSSKRLKSNKRKKIKRSRRKKKGIITTTEFNLLLSNETDFITTNKNNTLKKSKKRKNKRTKKRRNRRKKKLQNSNILEITTAKGILFPTNRNSNSTIDELIQQLNKNPEDSFEEFKKKHVNKTLIRLSNDRQLANLVAPAPITGDLRFLKNTTVTLHLNVGNITKNKYYEKKYNRCRKNKGGCAHFCNPKGKNKCTCLKGFELAEDQKTCLDINECEHNNGGCEAICVNTLGSFECRCNAGLRLADDQISCEDVNECLLRNGHGPCQDTCKNFHGSYKCSCEQLTGTKLDKDGHSCKDLDECAKDNGGCSHICINVLGRSFCTCPNGMELSSDWKTCQDINECEDDAVKMSCTNGCINLEGSYRCVDIPELQNDQALTSVACQPLFPLNLGFVSCSRKRAFHSYTTTGRKRITNSPGTTCRLVCPIGYKISGEFIVTCGLSGDWRGRTEGKCIRAPPPILHCPPTQYFTLDQGSNTTLVKFPTPTTNINWKYVKSYPAWAKELTGNLSKGQYDINFTVRDPTTKLFSSCSFKVVIHNIL